MILIAILLAGCTKVVYVEVTPAPTFTPSPTPTASPTVPITETPDENEGASGGLHLDPETILSNIQYGYEDTEDTQYEFEYSEEGNVYIIYVTTDGLAALALSAKSGDAKSIETWDKYMEATCDLNDAMLGYIEVVGSDASFSFIIRNDANPENTLASTLNSVVVYDVTK